MNTLTNIIPNPLNINKMLNSDYSASNYATSDYDGKNNCEILSKYQDNIIVNKLDEKLYLGGIGEIGLLMEKANNINEIIKQYNGDEILLDKKYASSTFYNDINVNNKKYSTKNKISYLWYYNSYFGAISYGSINDEYYSIPMYKYSIEDFDSTEDDYDELDNENLYLKNKSQNDDLLEHFNLLSYIYYSQDDIFDSLINTSLYVFFPEVYNKTTIQKKNCGFDDIYKLTTQTVSVGGSPINYQILSQHDENQIIYVSIQDGLMTPCLYINTKYYNSDSNKLEYYYYIYFENNNHNYLVNTNNPDIDIFFEDESITIRVNKNETKTFTKLPDDFVEMFNNNVLFYIDEINKIDFSQSGYNELNKDNIFKYPIYSHQYNNTNVYSLPLLPHIKLDNYYTCEFYIAVPEFIVHNDNNDDIEYNLINIYNNIKISIKFGDGEIKEILSPYIQLADVILYKFNKSSLFDHRYINNQEIIISLIDNSKTTIDSKVLWSKKIYFNIFELYTLQSSKNQINAKVKYNNYYPLKYPLSNKKKYLELDYIPLEKVDNIPEEILTGTNLLENTSSNKELISDQYNINLNNIINNYSYLNNDIYHNLDESNDMLLWFLKDNGYGLKVEDNNEYDSNNSYYSWLNFVLLKNDNENVITNTTIYCKHFMNYDEDGILDSDTSVFLQVGADSCDLNSHECKYQLPIYGMKEILYLSYNFNIDNLYNSEGKMQYSSNIVNNQRVYSIYEDYVFVYNNTEEEVSLYFTDNSLVLCEGTRLIHIQPKTYKLYKPSRHKNYNITIKGYNLGSYKLQLYKFYDNYKNNPDKVSYIINTIENISNYREIDTYIQLAQDTNNNELINIPIYDYAITPLFGNLVVVNNITNM